VNIKYLNYMQSGKNEWATGIKAFGPLHSPSESSSKV
jgi:hypothetical protein